MPIKILAPIDSDDDSDERPANTDADAEINRITKAFRESMRQTVTKMNDYESIEDSGKSGASSCSSKSTQQQHQQQRKKSILHIPSDKNPETTRKKSVR
jgi:hypothetical protein